MKNQYEWDDVSISILGEKVKGIKSFKYEPIEKKGNLPFTHYEGNFEILPSEIFRLYPELKFKPKKITNFQRKKNWKRFLRQFEIPENIIKDIVKNYKSIEISTNH